MGIIKVEGLGDVEIAGEVPTPEEQRQIAQTLQRMELEGQQQESASFLREAIPQAIGGIRDAAQQMLNNAIVEPSGSMYERYGRMIPLNSDDRPFQAVTLPTVRPPETAMGGLIRGTSQFLVPYLTAMRYIGVGQTAFSTFLKAEGTAILTEQAVFDPFDKKLSDFIQAFPMLQNPVTEYLQADLDDSEAEARFKLAVESTGLGLIYPLLRGGVRGLQLLRRGDSEQAVKLIDESLPQVPKIEEPPNPRDFLHSDARIEDFAANVNLNNLDTTDEIDNVLLTTAEKFSGRIEDARRGVVSDEQLRQLSIETGTTPEDLLARQTGEAWSAERILAARHLMVNSAERLYGLASKAAESGTETDLLAFKDALNVHVALQEQVSGLAAEAGRALRQFRLVAGSNVDEMIQAAGGKNNLRDTATLLASMDPEDLAGYNRASREANDPTRMDKFLEAWINGLLSGPQTHAVNALSNTMTSLWSIPEHYLAAGIGAIRRTEDRETFGEVTARAWGWFQGAKDGFSLAARTFITEEPSDVFTKQEGRRHRAIGGRLGQFVRVPGRALMASDEFFKSIGYRMELNALAYRSALDSGLQPNSREFAEHMQGIINSPPEDMTLQAIDNARYLTFTKPLEGVSRHITQAQAEIPALRLFMPFVRTPTNIVRFAGERTPFGVFMRETRNATGAARDRQYAKVIFGSMAGATVAGLASEGRITGSGPSDPAARAILRDSGWQPYSFVIDDGNGNKQYLAYNRVEPLGILFGLAADYAEIVGELQEGEADQLASQISASFAQNLTDKTFFKGLSDLITAINDPERFMDSYVRSMGGTLVPTGVAQMARVEDPILRDTRTVMDRIKSRIPGYSQELPARRNLWGEPIVLSGGLGPDIISPIYSSFSKNDPATNELVRLEMYPALPQRTREGKEIPANLYWSYVEDAGRPAHDQIVELVTRPEWRELDRFPETQKEIINDLITANRRVAAAILDLNMGNVLNNRDREILEEFGINTEALGLQ